MPSRIGVHHHDLPDIGLRALQAAGKSPPGGMKAAPTLGEEEALREAVMSGNARMLSNPGPDAAARP